MYYVQHQIRYNGEWRWHKVTPYGIADPQVARAAVDRVRDRGIVARVVDAEGVVVYELLRAEGSNVDQAGGSPGGDPPDFTMLGMADPLTPVQLRAKLDELEALDPVRRARAARAMSDVAQATFQAIGDAAIFEASRGMTNAELQRELGYDTPSAITDAIGRHLKLHPEDEARRKAPGRPRKK